MKYANAIQPISFLIAAMMGQNAAMKNTLKKALTTMVFVSLLSACSSVEQKPEQVAVAESVALLSSETFIPQQQYDEKGTKLLFVAQENPYVAKKVRVDKGSVLLFIEAKKAWRNNNSKKAEQKLKVISKKDPTLSGPWVMLGEMADEAKKYTKAQEYYAKALSINSQNVNGYLALAVSQRKMGKFNLAQNTLVKALMLWPDFPEAHYNLAILYDIYLNKTELAQKHLEAFLFLDEGDQAAQNWFKELAERNGVVASAVDSRLPESEFLRDQIVSDDS